MNSFFAFSYTDFTLFAIWQVQMISRYNTKGPFTNMDKL